MGKGHGIEELSGFATEFIREAGKKALAFYGKGKPQVKFDQGMVIEADLHLKTNVGERKMYLKTKKLMYVISVISAALLFAGNIQAEIKIGVLAKRGARVSWRLWRHHAR